MARVLAGAGLAIGVIGLVLRVSREPRSSWAPSPRTALIFLLAIAPVAAVAIYSWTRADILDSRNLITSWPGLALAIGTLVTRPARPLREVALVMTLLAFAIGAAKIEEASAQPPDVNAAVAFIDRVGAHGDPIVDLPIFVNPLSELDVALAQAGTPTYAPGNTSDRAYPATPVEAHPVIRLGSPPLAEQFSHLASPHPQQVFFGLAVTSPQDVARQATALARNGTIFLVAPVTSIPILLHYYPTNPFSLFLRALPPQYHVVRQMVFPGFAGWLDVTVYVLRDTTPSR